MYIENNFFCRCWHADDRLPYWCWVLECWFKMTSCITLPNFAELDSEIEEDVANDTLVYQNGPKTFHNIPDICALLDIQQDIILEKDEQFRTYLNADTCTCMFHHTDDENVDIYFKKEAILPEETISNHFDEFYKTDIVDELVSIRSHLTISLISTKQNSQELYFSNVNSSILNNENSLEIPDIIESDEDLGISTLFNEDETCTNKG